MLVALNVSHLINTIGVDYSLISGVYVSSRNVGYGVSKYKGMRCNNRWLRISGIGQFDHDFNATINYISLHGLRDLNKV